MKKKSILLITAYFLVISVGAFSQDRVIHIVGPRVGITYVITSRDDFNQTVQESFPDPDRKYFPLFSQFGVQIEQRIRLGESQSHFVFQEVLLLGGIDQSIIIPSFNFLVGFRSHIGFEFSLGPNVSFKYADESLEVPITVAYAVGWTFTYHDVYVPVNIAVVPTPKDGHPRLSLVTGFNFAVRGR